MKRKFVYLAALNLCLALIIYGFYCRASYAQGSPNPNQKEEYDKAEKNFQADPGEENTIWFGRRTAYLGHYDEAVKIFSDGLKRFPESYKLLRHRGHRYLSLRNFEAAKEDFKKALQLIKGKPLEIEPDGLPNAKNIPLSNTHYNIWYHLGLAYYVTHDFEEAAEAFRQCLRWSKNDDSLAATSHWLYMTLRRMNKPEAAAKVLEPIKTEMNIIEDHDYYQLLLLYKGLVPLEDFLGSRSTNQKDWDVSNATRWYGIANWYYYNGKIKKARNILQQILDTANPMAFGSIAAEADMKKLFPTAAVDK